MSDDTTPQFDPRFSAAFQRGFDPEAVVEKSVPEPVLRPRITEPAARVVPVTEATAAVPPATVPVTVDVAAAATQEVGQQAEFGATSWLDKAEAEPDAQPSTARNPFLLALGLVAVFLVAGGIGLFVASGGAFNSRDVRSQGDYMSLDALVHAAPFVALLGIATALGVLFVFAAKWRKRR
jgi:hypothetical protein